MLTITHDIKAPVGSIIGYTDLLERITTEERQRFYLNNMQSSAKHLLSLVNSLLDYHRLDAHKMDVNKVTFNPHQLFDTIYISFKPMANAKHLLLEYDCGEPLNRLYIGDPFRTRQIVENLLSNALNLHKKEVSRSVQHWKTDNCTSASVIPVVESVKKNKNEYSKSLPACVMHKDKKVSDWDWPLQKTYFIARRRYQNRK